MPDYSKSKIYCIRSHQIDKIYIGSTTLSLVSRLGEHRRALKFYTEGKGKNHHTKSFEILKYDDFYIELIENYPCNNKEELTKREYQMIRENNCVNKLKGIYTNIQDWREQNKEHIKEYSKNYEEKRREERKEKIKCECGCYISKCNITTHLKTKKHINEMERVSEFLSQQESLSQQEQEV